MRQKMNNLKNDEALKVQIYKFTLGLFFCYVPLSQLYIYLRMAFGCHLVCFFILVFGAVCFLL